ncbi:hypothetical protein BASA81_000098 [Batrachochytrium salamandrivorans]|nr:hypothetical protein BASA81_000098 [Batrachochytrium salamandrivorans]
MYALETKQANSVLQSLEDQNISDADMAQVAATLMNPHNRIRKLDLLESHVSAEGAKQLAMALMHQNNKIETLQ